VIVEAEALFPPEAMDAQAKRRRDDRAVNHILVGPAIKVLEGIADRNGVIQPLS
jgi:hypothetical protein